MWSDGPTTDDMAHWAANALEAFAERSSAQDAVEAFQRSTRTDLDSLLADLMCDLMHWADRNGGGFDASVARARATDTPPGAAPDQLADLLAALEAWADAHPYGDLHAAIEHGRSHYVEEIAEEIADREQEQRERSALQAEGAA